MKLSDYIASFVAAKQINTVFTIPGGGSIFLIDAFGRNSEIDLVVNHHEQGCALAAEGYARITGKPGACVLTTGPGGSNAWTGALCSYQDSIPVIFISGNVNRNLTTNYTGLDLRQLGDQEFNTVKTVKNFTKYAVQVNDPLRIKYHMEKAYHLAITGRPGPVWVDIPLDIQNYELDISLLESYIPEEPSTGVESHTIKLVAEKLFNSKKPLIVVGHGVRISKSIDLLDDILENYSIPVVTSFNGIDSVSNEYQYFCGRFGVLGQIAANKIVEEADFVLSLGSRLHVKQTGYDFKNFAKKAYRVYVDIDKAELDKPTLFPDLKVNCDVKEFLKALKPRLRDLPIDIWREYCKETVSAYPTVLERHREANPLSAYGVVDELNNFMGEGVDVVTSNGTAAVVGLQVIKLKKNQRFIGNKATAPMGYGLPAAIGVSFGTQNLVLCLEGDGSLHMNIQELQVMSQNKLPIKLVVFNNDGYLSIKITQKSFCDGNLVLSDPTSGLTLPSYSEISKAYGIPYRCVRDKTELRSTLEKVFKTSGPEIIEIFVDPLERHEPKVMATLGEGGRFIPGKLGDIAWAK